MLSECCAHFSLPGGQRWTQTMCEANCERGWKEGSAPALVEVYSRHPRGPSASTQTSGAVPRKRICWLRPSRARGHFPRDGTRWLTSLATCFCCCPCSSPVYFSPRDNDGPRKSRVSLCRPSCPASVFRMSPHNIIICTSVCYFACITRCFCVLVVGQRDRKPSKVKLASSLVRGMSCCEKCGSEFFFYQCGNCNRDVGIWDMGTRQGWISFGRVNARAPGQVVSDFILD